MKRIIQLGPRADSVVGADVACQIARAPAAQLYPSSIVRNRKEKDGERPSVLDYGAKADGQILIDGAISSGSHAFSSASAAFASTEVGKVIWIEGAGTSGADLLTTIASYVSATAITTTAAAGTTVTAALTR